MKNAIVLNHVEKKSTGHNRINNILRRQSLFVKTRERHGAYGVLTEIG